MPSSKTDGPIHRALDAFNRGDVEAFRELFVPDAQWHPTPRSAFPEPRCGREGIGELFALWTQAWERVRALPEDIVSAGDRCVATVVFSGVAAGSGLDVEFRRTGVFSFRDGKISCLVDYETREEALTALAEGSAA